MGLFGGKKVYVSSTVYNMAGPEEERIQFLKTVVNSSIISNTKFSMSDVITNNYLNGPGIKVRSFHRWAKRPGNYDQIGIPKVNIYSPGYDVSVIAANIPAVPGQTHSFKYVRYGPAEYSYWAEQWVMANYQNRMGTAWTADYDVVTNTITVTWEAGTVPATSSFNPTINFGSNYYYTVYEARQNSPAAFLGSYMWIYEAESGNAAMDAMPVKNPLIGEFLPFIPVRIKNNFLSSTYKPEAYAIAKKAYKKATGGKKFDKLVELIADNDDLEDIDHCYMVYGVALNAVDNAARKYLFKFFDFVRTAQVVDYIDFGEYESNYESYATSEQTYSTERVLYLDTPIGEGGGGGEGGGAGDPANTTPSPQVPTEPINEIQIKSTGPLDTKLNMVIKWNSITKVTGTGIKLAGKKKGDVWWDESIFGTDREVTIGLLSAILLSTQQGKTVKLNWQKTDDYWETLEIIGMVHKNLIYDGKSVDTPASIAIADVDESGFIVPIHYETMRSMSLIDSTQMMCAGTYLVFNSYEVVKQKWYQTGIFKIFIFVVMIVITVATMGATAPGLLGAAGAVGATLGFTGIVATIVGAIANAIAAMILMQIISVVSTAVFGAKIGAIIATVASVVAMSFGSSLMAGQSMATAWGNLMNVVNILQITSSVGNGIAGYMQASAMDWQQKSANLMAEYEKASADIQKMWIDEFGRGDFHFDPNQLTNNNPMGIAELPQSFLDRTLMTGSDIADMTNDMLSNFASLTLDVNTIGR